MKTTLALLFLFACSHPTKPTAPMAPGGITGSVHFVGTPCAQPGQGCDGPMPNYEVVVRSKDGKTIIGKATTDAEGKYTVAVGAGEYTIMTPAGLRPEDQKRNDVTVAAGNTVTLDLTVDTGVR